MSASLILPLPHHRYGLDAVLVGAAALLLAWGLVMVASASVAQAEKVAGDAFYYLYRQAFFVVLGLGCATLAFCVPIRQWQASSGWLLLLALFLLTMVLVPGIGISVNSARRWLDLGPFRMQASEPARLALIVFLAGHICRHQLDLQQGLKGLLRPLLIISVPTALLLAEPDFGASVILLLVTLLMLFLGGARLLHFFTICAVGVAAMGAIALSESYRVARIKSFIDPWADVENGGWQLAQSLIAVGRGEWTGVGLGNSVQKLLYLPEMHTDFIFAILAEEFGLLGVLIMLALFGLVIWRSFAIAAAAEARGQRFGAYLCYGLGGWLALQTLISMAVNLGLAPTKGLTLPLISYGGSSLLTVLVMLALVLRVDYEGRDPLSGVRA
jgi:cell division protein FtsW